MRNVRQKQLDRIADAVHFLRAGEEYKCWLIAAIIERELHLRRFRRNE